MARESDLLIKSAFKTNQSHGACGSGNGNNGPDKVTSLLGLQKSTFKSKD